LGFTLIEACVAMWAMSITLMLGATLLLAAMRADQVGAATLRRLTWWAELADEFRADVGRAATAPDQLGELARGPSCLILRMSDGSHVVYRWHEEQLVRTVQSADGETRRAMPVGNWEASVEFARTDGDRPLLTLTVIESPNPGTPRRTAISAMLGGDVR